MMELNLENLQRLICAILSRGGRQYELTPDQELLGIADSMAMLGIITAIEEHFGIVVEGDMLTVENFTSIASIYAMLISVSSQSG